MADRQRRQAPTRAALSRLGRVLLAVLWASLTGCAEAPRAAVVNAAPTQEAVQPTPAAAPRAPSLPTRHGALNRRFTVEIEAGIDCARRHSSGRARPDNVRVSISVRELGPEPVELVALRVDEARLPASNMKLVTTAAALVLLGTRQEFSTPFYASGPLVDGVLEGDLVLRAAGDPLWHPEGRADRRLAEAVRALRARGVRRVTGDLVLDEGTFLEPGPGPGWPDPSQHWADYCARSAGFSAAGGCLRAEVTPGAVGVQADIAVHPSPHGLRSRYGVTTTRRGRIDVRVGATVSTVTVKGNLPASRETFVATFAHPDPVELFGSVLLGALRTGGIRLDGELRRERDVSLGADGGVRLAELRSSVDELFYPINAESENGVADQLFLALGHTVAGAGTRAGGAQAVGLALERLGVPETGLVQVDGSGLSRDNRISARQIVALLESVLAGPSEASQLLLDSLAVAGRSGTLEERMKGTSAEGRVFAKTGWIAGASALSGVAYGLDGRTRVFSILVEYPPQLGGLNRACFKPLQNRLVTILVEEEAP